MFVDLFYLLAQQDMKGNLNFFSTEKNQKKNVSSEMVKNILDKDFFERNDISEEETFFVEESSL